MAHGVVLAILLAMAASGVLNPAEAGISILPYEAIDKQTEPPKTAVTTTEPAAAGTATATPPSVTEAEAETSTSAADKAAEQDCQDQIGTIEEGVPVNTMRPYDVKKLLEEFGGAPGSHNVTWDKDVPEFPVEDPTERPLPDTDNGTFWLYDFRRSDLKTYVRLEHALFRNKGQKDEYVDIRGELWWTPPDFCGKARHARYRVSPHEGFVANVSLEYCWFGSDELGCAYPSNCWTKDGFRYCVAAPSSALLASLVG